MTNLGNPPGELAADPNPRTSRVSGAIHFPYGTLQHAAAGENPATPPKYLPAQSIDSISPLQLGAWIVRALTHLRRVRKTLGFLSRNPLYSQIVQSNPRFAFKFLTDDYLARGFTTAQAADCFLHHYTRLQELLSAEMLRPLLEDEIPLHVIPDGSNRFALTLGLSRPYDNEGELTLRLRVDGEIVSVLSFTIVPGTIVECDAPEVMLITRLQGIKGCFEQITQATRALNDVAPSALLIAALQGVAQGLGIHALAAVPAERQTSYKAEVAEAFKHAYDNLFTELGLLENPTGFFHSPVPIQPRPISVVQRSHRARTRKKRAFKLEIQQACAEFFQRARS